VSVTEPSDAVNTEMAKQADGRRLAQKRKSPPSVSSLFGWFPAVLLVHMTCADGTERSETSVYETSDTGLSPKRKNTKLLVMFIITTTKSEYIIVVANCVSARQGRFTGAIIKGRKYMSIA
jgi:hypothetical protein